MANLVEILVTAKDLTGPAMTSVNARVNGASRGMAAFHKTALLAGAAFVGIGVEAVKMAAKFDSSMLLLQTQAGVSKDKMAGLKQGVLDLAGKVGQSPDSLAEALFHVESNFESMGITSAKALALTETAAKGATVGHADLVDVTNALTAAVASGIPGVQNFDQAMGVLNATVGVGDMKMQDLANAFGSGMVATVKGFGLNITDVGAALAVFGDNNIRGALAGNQLRMSVMALAKPITGGTATLKSLGLQADTLAKDMQKGGLKLALEDLVAHMKAAGVSSKEQGLIITEAFGRKAGSGLNILVSQVDRFESKYPALIKGAKSFSQSWEDTKKSFAFQMKSMQTGFEALMISIGQKMIPPLQSFIHLLSDHKRATVDAAMAMAGLLAAVVAVSAAMKVAAGVELLWGKMAVGAAAVKTAMAAVATEAILMQAAFVTAGGGMRGMDAAFATMSTTAKTAGAILLIGGLAIAAERYSSQAKRAKISSDEMANGLKQLAAGKSAGDLINQLSRDSGNLHQSLTQKLKSNDSVWDIITNSGAKTSSANKDYKQLGRTLTEMVKSGDAKTAAAALAKINASGKQVPTKYLKDYQGALAGVKLDSELTAASQGRFGAQAQQVQQDLQAQQDVVDGLTQSLQALDQVNQDSYNSQTKFEDAISKATAALKTDGKTLDVHTDKGRANRDALSAVAAATDDYTAKLTKQGAQWTTIDGVYKRGYDSLVKAAEGMGKSKQAAEALAKSLLHLPPEVKLGGNITDLEAKLAKAKRDLKAAPSSKKAKIEGDIADLEKKIAKAKADLASLQDKTVGINIVTTHTGSSSVAPGGTVAHEGGGYASGGMAPVGQTAWVGEDGPELMQVTPLGTRVYSTADSKKLAKINGIKVPGYAKGTISKAQQAALDRAAAERTAQGDIAGNLNISYFGRAAGYRTNNFENAAGRPSGVGDLAATLNDWQNKIRAATHGALESKLVRAFDRFGVAALKNEKALLAVNDKLTAARDKLTALKDSFAQLRDSVASSVVSYGSIAKSGTGQPGGAKSVISQLSTDTTTAKRFASDLAALKKKGLNSQSLSELAQAGIDGGGLENAERLLGANKGDIKTINALEKQLKAAAASAGGTTANSVYGQGIKQAQGLVDGLKKQQSRLDSIMAHAAAAMANELRHTLGRKATGGIVGAAATGGNRWGRTLVGEYGPEIADLPIGSRVHSAPDTARMLGGGGQGGRPIELTLELGGRRVAKVLIDPLREEIRELGGDVQHALGRR